MLKISGLIIFLIFFLPTSKDKNIDNQVIIRKYESKTQKLQAEFKEQLNARWKYEIMALGLLIVVFLIWFGIRLIIYKQ
jgi:Ca2+/Na+ antiporter